MLTGKEGEPKADEPKEDDPKAEANPLHGAPEGDYEVSLPEGAPLDKEALEMVAPIAKELNLSNEGFGKLVTAYADQVLPRVTEQLTTNLQNDIAATHAQWATEASNLIKNDEIFEGKPQKDVLQVSAKAIDRFGGPEFRTFLDETGLGNHPAMVKAFYQIGNAIAEDTTFERGGKPSTEKARTEKYYGPQS